MALHITFPNSTLSDAERDEALVIGHLMYACEIGPELKEDNVLELWMRIKIISGLSEFRGTTEAYRKFDSTKLRQYLGLKINNGKGARGPWLKRQIEGAMMTENYNHNRRKEA